MSLATEIKIGSKRLKLSNLDKVFYPKSGFTKGDVIEYYTRVAPVLLPHLKDRPLTLKRYPNGAEGEFFYEKNCPAHRPDWVETAAVWSEDNQRDINFCLANDLPTLIWTANLAALELHTSLSQKKDPMRPTMLAIDLDPGPPAGIIQCTQVALWLRAVFDELELESFPKTSGSKGLQIYVPLNTQVTYDQTKPFARHLAEAMEGQHPELVVSNMRKSLRRGKVFIDWSQNDDHKTTVCAYSLRAKDEPAVSTPVTWREVEDANKRRDPDRLKFTSSEVLRRIEKYGDLFAPVLKLKQKLPKLG